MSDEEIVKYVKNMIANNLAERDCWQEVLILKIDETNKVLIAHIDGLIKLFTKAKKILENEGGKDEQKIR